MRKQKLCAQNKHVSNMDDRTNERTDRRRRTMNVHKRVYEPTEKMAFFCIAFLDLIFHSWCKFPTATVESTLRKPHQTKPNRKRTIYFMFRLMVPVLLSCPIPYATEHKCIGVLFNIFNVFDNSNSSNGRNKSISWFNCVATLFGRPKTRCSFPSKFKNCCRSSMHRCVYVIVNVSRWLLHVCHRLFAVGLSSFGRLCRKILDES